MIEPQSDSDDRAFGASGSYQEFEAELQSFPPGTPATPRPGRIEEAREIWESFQKSKQTPFFEFTDSGPEETTGRS